MSVFESRESKKEEMLEPKYEDICYLNQIAGGEHFNGTPKMGDIRKIEWEDKETGKKKTQYSATLIIDNDRTEESLIIRVKAKSLDNRQEAWSGSVLFDIIDSIESLEDPTFAGMNNVHSIEMNELKGYINSLAHIEGEIIDHESKNFNWSTFRITKAEMEA